MIKYRSPLLSLKNICKRFKSDVMVRSNREGVCPYDVNSSGNTEDFGLKNESIKIVKKFEDIPGPRAFPFIGTLWNYVPVFGEYSFSTLDKNAQKKNDKYGPLVLERVLPGVNVLHIYDPEDIETVLRASGKYPERRSHIALQKYRKEKPDVYNSGGILPTNGEEWWKIRSLFQKPLSSPKKAKTYVNLTNSVVDDFVKVIERESPTNQVDMKIVIPNFLPHLSRLNLELICIIAFDVRLGSFSPAELLETSFSSEMIEATRLSNYYTVKTDYSSQLLEYFNTPAYKKFCKVQEFIEKAAVDFVAQKMAYYKENIHDPENAQDKEPSLLESYLSNPDIDLKDIVGMSVDLLLGGVDTTSFTTSFALYHLANNPSAQDLLFDEAKKLLPKREDVVSESVIGRASYLKACLKESMRINPISIGFGRTAKEDLVLSGYHVPKGTIIVTNNQVACNSSEHFANPSQFFPERWLRGNEMYQQCHPFLYLPFGHGPRMCIARRLAEQNMHITLLKLVRNFKIGWEGKKLGIETMTINMPDQPINISFTPRNE